MSGEEDTGLIILFFKKEIYKYESCKRQLTLHPVDIEIHGTKYQIKIPEFNSKFLKHISALFSNLIL
ncbi:MAG: hypothetical protein GXP45_08540 [bacterium]|nr:hypothetical protein [bacterium]